MEVRPPAGGRTSPKNKNKTNKKPVAIYPPGYFQDIPFCAIWDEKCGDGKLKIGIKSFQLKTRLQYGQNDLPAKLFFCLASP